ncbi:MAG TPA: hypothetical protein VFS21_29995 [Roseiflexaceae bacterium]|nr:hypothetical protein [Roseiflexaceae bacterium]
MAWLPDPLARLFGAPRPTAVIVSTTPQDERQAQLLWWLWAHCYLPAMERDLRLRMARATAAPLELDTAPLDEPDAPPAAPAADDAQLAGWLEGIQGREPQP